MPLFMPGTSLSKSSPLGEKGEAIFARKLKFKELIKNKL